MNVCIHVWPMFSQLNYEKLEIVSDSPLICP